jgi:carbamoyl-phosphate synthase large subunit
MTRVLFVGGGRRVSLAKYFIAEGFEVLAYETDKNAPIGIVATLINGMAWDEPEIATDLLDVCEEYAIDLAIPLQDKATVILAKMAEKAAKPTESRKKGTQIPTASEQANELCLNKELFAAKLLDRTYYPSVKRGENVIVKPKFGFNSKGLKIVSYDEYEKLCEHYSFGHGGTHIVQRYIEGGYEISVDAYFNRQGKMVDAVPRKRIEVQGGEVSKSITLRREAFGVLDITREVGEEFGLRGPTCFQYVIDTENAKPYIMEANARFGGGTTLSIAAGLNTVKMIKDEYIDGLGCLPKVYDWKVGFGMTRYTEDHYYGR